MSSPSNLAMNYRNSISVRALLLNFAFAYNLSINLFFHFCRFMLKTKEKLTLKLSYLRSCNIFVSLLTTENQPGLSDGK